MRPVDLLPPSQRPRRAGGRSGSAYVIVGALACLLVGTLVYVLTANGVTDQKAELAKLEQETQAAQQRAAALSAYGSFAQIRAVREASVRQLAQARIDWERLMRELSRLLPDNAWITALDATAAGTADPANSSGAAAAGPTLKLTGCAPRQRDVATVMVRLRELHRAVDVTLSDSAREGNAASSGEEGGSAGGESCGRGYRFSVQVAFSPVPVKTEKKRVPGHLGGGA